MFGLLIMILFILFLHKKVPVSQPTLFTNHVYHKTLFVLVLYIFTQLNFNLVSHNFGLKITQFVNTAQFFITLLTLLLYLQSSVIKGFVLGTSGSLLTYTKLVGTNPPRNHVWWFLLSTLLILEFLLSFAPLVNDFT